MWCFGTNTHPWASCKRRANHWYRCCFWLRACVVAQGWLHGFQHLVVHKFVQCEPFSLMLEPGRVVFCVSQPQLEKADAIGLTVCPGHVKRLSTDCRFSPSHRRMRVLSMARCLDRCSAALFVCNRTQTRAPIGSCVHSFCECVPR